MTSCLSTLRQWPIKCKLRRSSKCKTKVLRETCDICNLVAHIYDIDSLEVFATETYISKSWCMLILHAYASRVGWLQLTLVISRKISLFGAHGIVAACRIITDSHSHSFPQKTSFIECGWVADARLPRKWKRAKVSERPAYEPRSEMLWRSCVNRVDYSPTI